jgi:hypothetical protein
MKKLASYLLISVLVLTGFLTLDVVAWGPVMESDPLACDRCHTCEKPTQTDQCLISCARTDAYNKTGKHEIAEAPDSITLDVLADKYTPTLFDHKLHASMSQISTDCATCHHFSPPGKIPPCRSCHPTQASSDDPDMPNLKVAYHRQCLSCHVEWSHNADCGVCHSTSRPDAQMPHAPVDKSILPKVAVPVSRSYATTYELGPVVTFQHVMHIELFDFSCVDCHHQERCAYCHDPVRPNENSMTLGQVQSTCQDCHEMCPDSDEDLTCQTCHHLQEQPPKFHEIVGRDLPTYLEHLGCKGCHLGST